MTEGCHVFVSVGSTATAEQEAFVSSVEARLRAEGLQPHTVGRDTFSAEAPLKAVTDLMDRCSGAVVIAFERTYLPAGVEKRGGPRQTALNEVRLPTPWNQIEAAMAYSRRLPLLMIVEKGLKSEGLLEQGYDWYVQDIDLQESALGSVEFNGVLSSWKSKVQSQGTAVVEASADPEKMSVADLVGRLKVAQLWSVLGALAVLVAGAFTLGAKLFAGK